MKEIWKDVAGYEGFYQVSNRGRIMRVAGGKGATIGRILIPVLNRHTGYLRVTLCRNGKRSCLYVHRLVAETFLKKPSPDHDEVNHKSGNKHHNGIENLAWVTGLENSRHASEHGLNAHGEAHGCSRLTRQQVRQIRQLYATGDYLQRDLGDMFGVHQAHIGDIVRGDRWKHVGGMRTQGGISRHAKGEANGSSRLTRKQVKKIRELYATGKYTQQEIGEIFGTLRTNISKIVRRKTWSHVP